MKKPFAISGDQRSVVTAPAPQRVQLQTADTDPQGKETPLLDGSAWLSPRPRRTAEISMAETELFEKLWYHRHKLLEARGQDGCEDEVAMRARASAEKVEKKYGIENLVFDDHAVMELHGKLSAIRWVLGYEWDYLDT